MAKTNKAEDRRLKPAVKDALREKLSRAAGWLREVVAEALEDMALVAAIREGRTSKVVSREAISES